MKEVDVLIIGSGGAGTRAAIEASKKVDKVLVVSKGRMGKTGATLTAGADIDVDSRSAKELLGLKGDVRDSKEIFLEDIVIEGRYINNQKLVEVHVEDAPLRVKELMDWGMKVTDFTKAPGHRYHRGVYTSGIELMKTLINEAKRHPNIQLLEDTMMLDLFKHKNRAIGAIGLNLRTGEFEIISAKAIIIATGGAQMIFPVQTAPEGLTGDGQAMAWRAGAELVDMEMTQFLPGTFINPPAWRGIDFPFTISMGGGLDGWLLNKYGKRFMRKWDSEKMEQSTRDILSIAIMTEVLEGRGSPSDGVYLSFAHLPNNLIENYCKWACKPFLTDNWDYQGFKFKNLMEEVKKGFAIEVVPAIHFFMGGIRVDTEGVTSVEGLFAAGEVSGGLHGGNRLSGNACTQIIVQGKRSGEAAGNYAVRNKREKINKKQIDLYRTQYFVPIQKNDGINPFEVKRKIQKISWEYVGVLRTGEGLRFALKKINKIMNNDLNNIYCKNKERTYNCEWIEALQVKNMLTVLKAVALSANERKESRGAHFRQDYPEIDNNNWLKNIVIKNQKDLLVITTLPAVTTRLIPNKKRINNGF